MSKEIKIEIKNRWTGSILFEYSSIDNTLAKTVEKALEKHTDLCGANLCDANLRGANLRGADLCDANLRGANLRGANLCGANLCGANLCDANLCDANLCGANLRDANLRGANLRGANLCGANLCDANLCDANLRGANLRGARGGYLACPSEGSFIAWKKASGYIVKLQIMEDSRRSSAGGYKCRCDKAFVMEIQSIDGAKAEIQTVCSSRDVNFVYTAGATVEVPDFDDCRWNECAPGIHFFIDRQAAVEY
ncbi:DUF5758 domain-containing protein [Alistipes sp.]|uniref:pentapeptide repeat-containing protein n=1 Tax=Alistipes sp. TaxID=1872444 RepID=UPI003AB6124C